MPNLKEVRNRIASVKSTQQITSAMKMVAASKLRKAQNAILAMRPFASKLLELMQGINSGFEELEENPFAEVRQPEKVLIIPVTSNKGLCGSFNANVIKATNKLIAQSYQQQLQNGNVHLFCIGKKGYEFFKKLKVKNLEYNIDILDHLSFENTKGIADELMAAFAQKQYDKIEIVYNQFKNAAVQRLMVEQFLPLVPPGGENETQPPNHTDFIFQPDKAGLVKAMIPKSLKIQLYKALLDSYASEQGARMTAMHKATDNAQELLIDLRLTYNKARQAAITSELLEIISGAEALKG